MYRLTTRDGDEWDFEDLEEARKNQYIFSFFGKWFKVTKPFRGF